MDKPRHHCAVFGVAGPANAAELAYFGLFSMQHRGQESAGIATSNGATLGCFRGMGLVGDVFRPPLLAELGGPLAIGHVRYSTSGSTRMQNAQPLLVEYKSGQVALGLNGNLVNAPLLRSEYESRGSIFQTTTDTEILVHMMAHEDAGDKLEALARCLPHLQGAYCFTVLFEDMVIGVRDPFGIRPLSLGRLAGGDYCVASESCAFDLLDAGYVRDVEPGEMVILTPGACESRRFVSAAACSPKRCIFEHVYFARPDSVIFEETVHRVRQRMGRRLAREHPVAADIVVPIPDSGISAAMGYAEQSGIPLEQGFIRNHYVGRTFIQPADATRTLGVKMKLNVIGEVVAGKRLVVVDDSIVRGNTTRGKIENLRAAGATEIHMRVSCPPLRHPCHYGVDFPTYTELLAHERDLEQIRRKLEVDSIGYLSLEGMLASAKHPAETWCHACWSGEYAVPVDYQVSKFAMERYQLRMFEPWQ